jgi:hypothetical protein
MNTTVKESKVEQKHKPGQPAVMIATPMYGGMCTGNYTAGIIKTFAFLQQHGVLIYWTQISNESLITRARNELTRLFLEQEQATHLMFVDADISFEGDAIMHLLAADKDIACGLYPKKEIDWGQIERAAKDGKENLKDYGGAFVLNMESPEQDSDERGLIEVRHGGTGFMLIKRRVFEQLKDHVPTYRVSTVKDQSGNYTNPLVHEFFATSIDSTGALLSEDYHFCDLWRKHGGKIYANPFLKLEHVGTYIYTGDVVRAGGNLK